MRLNPFNTGNINVRSSGGGAGAAGGGLGCGTIILAALGYFIFGIDPFQTAATVESRRRRRWGGCTRSSGAARLPSRKGDPFQSGSCRTRSRARRITGRPNGP